MRRYVKTTQNSFIFSLSQSLTIPAGLEVAEFIDLYVLRDHRDSRGSGCTMCSGLMKPDTHLGENAHQIEVSDDQVTESPRIL
ncbi:hypothetical protein PS850_03561 [Pseudomonas fluorescens]|nr:hypothetical protein PS850_03561 [Pseudomonas fluorescens]